MVDAQMKKVAIIGAGPSGLISIKTCIENGLEPVCFEMTDDIGGLWNYKTSLIHQKGSVMRSTIINSSKENMAFSDYPAPKEFANFMHNKQLIKYFRMYAEEFKLHDKIKFNTKVTRLVQNSDYETTGKWIISYCEKDDMEIVEVFDAVMICNGHHACPNIPEFKGLNDANAKFKGEVLHAWKYREPFGFVDKRVLVVGVGNSGGDIGVELSRIASQTYLSTRSGMWCAPRSLSGWPTDITLLNRFNNLVNVNFPEITYWFQRRIVMKNFDHEAYGIIPATSLRHHIFVNDDLPNRIASGTLVMKSNVREFTENSCIFEDGTVVEDLDAVILATGYKIGFPWLDDSIISVNNNWVNLYKYVFPPQLQHATLAVMGCIQPLGSINPIVEMQARWATLVFKGESKLPSSEEMNTDIKAKAEIMRKTYEDRARHTIQVDSIPYLDEIAELIGCKPYLCQYLISDCALWRKIFFGSFSPYQYRLNGPGAKPELARNLIFTQDERIRAPFQTRKATRPKEHDKSIDIIYAIVAIAIFLIVLIFQIVF